MNEEGNMWDELHLPDDAQEAFRNGGAVYARWTIDADGHAELVTSEVLGQEISKAEFEALQAREQSGSGYARGPMMIGYGDDLHPWVPQRVDVEEFVTEQMSTLDDELGELLGD